MNRYRAALQAADFRRLLAALAVDASGSWAYGVVLLVYVYSRTHSSTWVAATAVVRYLPGLLFSAYAGVIAERYERTRVMLVSSLTCCAVMAVMATLVALHGPVLVIVVLAVVSSAAYTPYAPSVGALLPELVSEDQLAAANALQASVQNLSVVVGPAIGAALLLLSTASPAFALNGLTFLFSAVCISRITVRSTPSAADERGPGPWAQMTVGARTLLDTPAGLVPVVFCVLATFVYGTDTVLFVPVSAQLHGGASGYGYLLAAQAVGGIGAVIIVNRVSGGARLAWWVGGGMALYCLPSLAVPWLHSMGPGLGVQFARGAGTLVVDVLALTALQRAIPRHLLSRVLGIFQASNFAAAAAGSLLMPLLLHVTSFRTTLISVSVVVPAIALTGIPTLIRLDRDARGRLLRLRPVVELLGRLEPFAAANPPLLERLAEAAEQVHVSAGSVVIREGDPSDAFYVVVSGEVAVGSRSGDVPARSLVAAGDSAAAFFGEIGLLHGIPRTATVSAVTDTDLLRIPAQEFREALGFASINVALFAVAGARLARTHPSLVASDGERRAMTS